MVLNPFGFGDGQTCDGVFLSVKLGDPSPAPIWRAIVLS